MKQMNFQQGETIYENPLTNLESIEDWITEGEVKTGIWKNKLLLENKLDPEQYGDNAHWLLWCPVEFPDQIIIEWDFYPLQEPGLCMLFFAATGRNGEDLFDPSLPERTGYYPDYHSGAINALHLSYFRHKHANERAFRTCNLRKSYGFHLVTQAADPLPPAEDAISPYHMKLIKYKQFVQFSINDLPILEWEDDGTEYGPILQGGKIGFRQMAPMVAAYANFSVKRAILC
ncbi:protein of unknown function [Gracilibacillus ureilyticus]|uniref:DUF1961 domain-containing protein n=1 Tax=Gracilibacillus ureilyticus TaxID=531814 RepID=A0A1H9P464_9BACI|nr:DUF1961 family protein [Gracilibacillus ureilyticus]SER42695.1 protein of unknown function [Gracilibacillus ureilyticus]